LTEACIATLLHVFEDLANQRRVLDTGNDAKLAATMRTGLDKVN
jgi:hypothetical protein